MLFTFWGFKILIVMFQMLLSLLFLSGRFHILTDWLLMYFILIEQNHVMRIVLHLKCNSNYFDRLLMFG